MGTWDKFAHRQFAKDESGRLVFLPRGPHRPAYFIDSSDENKLKSLVKVYGVAAAIINLTGSMASLAFTQALAFDERSAPLAYKLKLALWFMRFPPRCSTSGRHSCCGMCTVECWMGFVRR
jgi:hypothetical protein